MEQLVTTMVEQMARTKREMARILISNRETAAHLSQNIHSMPDRDLSMGGLDVLTEYAMKITKNVTSYLNVLADLEEAMADQLSHVMAEWNDGNEGNE